jgi:hypothetical protein
MKPILPILFIIISSLSIAAPAFADPDENDVRIAARMLSFLEKPLTGPLRVGIVVAVDDPHSSSDAAALSKFMESGVGVTGLSLIPVLVPVEDVDRAKVDLLFLTDGVGERGSKVGDAARAEHIPCITLDIDQVRNGNCAIGIKSDPRVEILVNHDAASRSGVDFAGAFKMLVTEF